MSDYISMTGLRQAIRADKCHIVDGEPWIPLTELDTALAKAAVNDQPRVNAEWLPRNPKDPDRCKYYCSNCKTDISALKSLYYKFCPECGAKMKIELKKMSLKDLARELRLFDLEYDIHFSEQPTIEYVNYNDFVRKD